MPRIQTPPPCQRLGATSSRRLASEQTGFTLIEMVIVVLILGILVAVAIPSYVGLSERADKSAATTNVRAVVSDVEAYYSDWGSFDGISPSVLHNNYDSSIDISLIDVSSTESGASFMLCSKSHSFYAYKAGPASPVQTDTAQPTGCGL